MSSPFFLSPLPLSNNSNSKIPISSSFTNTLSLIPLKTSSKPHYYLKVPSVIQANTPPSTNKTQSSNPNSSFPSHPSSKTNEGIKMPTPPWMKGPLLVPSDDILDLSRTKTKPNKGNVDERSDWSLTDKVSGGRGKKAMRGIIESVTKLQNFRKLDEPQRELDEFEFRVPLEKACEDGNLKGREESVPWAKADRIVIRRMKKERVVTAAELTLPEMVLKRLRSDAVKITKWVKAKKAGVTQKVVDEIKMTWRKNELAMIKFYEPLCRNMDRAREIVEIKTGGMVVWSTNDSHVVYRGCNYEPKTFQKLHTSRADADETFPSDISSVKIEDDLTISHRKSDEVTIDGKDGVEDSSLNCMEERLGLPSVHGTLYEREADRILDGLGPRFIDWWWPKPLPVDADLLPELVPGYRMPFRRCPPHVRPKLTDDELTYLRKLARPLPTHFALGRNTKLQGLAAAIIKLWEKSLIAKIAVKLGILNTNNEQMARELKHLTGGVLILRNKFFIIFYRGKDFLPSEVANLVVDRETELKTCQLLEEGARRKAIETFSVTDEAVASTSSAGTFTEFQDIQTKYRVLNNENRDINVQMEAEKEKLEKELRKNDREISILKWKMEKSANELAKLNSSWRPSEQTPDQELITEEERYCLRKIGLKMDKPLVLGRRGIFNGVIGSIHQHWKHREVVKVITMQRAFSQVIDTAMMLEVESGGILVAVEKLIRGRAIILYRGKNYRRPLQLVPGNLLTKRAALQRSLEMQRIGSMKFFAYQKQRTISNLKLKLSNLQRRTEQAAPCQSENPWNSEPKRCLSSGDITKF